jgi:plasmid stabilization system protein ParE
MQVRWTHPAVADLTGIFDYLAEHQSHDLAERVISTLFEAAESLGAMPKKGRPGRETDTRRTGDPALSVYRFLHA